MIVIDLNKKGPELNTVWLMQTLMQKKQESKLLQWKIVLKYIKYIFDLIFCS